MNPPLIHATPEVVSNTPVARATYRLRLAAPELAERIAPGQFVMLRLLGRMDPLLGRAFALYDTAPDGSTLDLVYAVVGKLTTALATLRPGDRVVCWGPLGQPFPDYAGVGELVCVAGGIGHTPFPALLRRVLGLRSYAGQPVRREVSRASIYYGARSADYLAGLEDFQASGARVALATDDGSAGHAGRVTDLLTLEHQAGRCLAPTRWVGCGPEPMLHALARLAESFDMPCDVSLETPMACGIGICFSCVTKVKVADGWDYRRVCVDGPVFSATQLCW